MKIGRETMDPRVRRTREMLHCAFEELLREKSFEDISVQDIAERSTVNRATFYDHFPDKFALLEDLIGEDFRRAIRARLPGGPPSCPEAIRGLVLAVCDYLKEMSQRCQRHRRQFAPMAESVIKQIVRQFLLEGMSRRLRRKLNARDEMQATLASWTICGAGVEWSKVRRGSQEAFVDRVLPIVLAAALPD